MTDDSQKKEPGKYGPSEVVTIRRIVRAWQLLEQSKEVFRHSRRDHKK